MRSLILLSLIAAVVLANPTSPPQPDYDPKPKPDYNPKPKPVDIGGRCEGTSGLHCKTDLACEARGVVPKMYAGICVPKPGDVGQDCGGGTLYARTCKPGLKCVVDGTPMPGKKGTCRKDEPYAKEGEICVGYKQQTKKCSPGYLCINKNPLAMDYPSKCYKEGDITVVGEGDCCEGKTQNKCKSGLECKAGDRDIKVCKKKPLPPKYH